MYILQNGVPCLFIRQIQDLAVRFPGLPEIFRSLPCFPAYTQDRAGADLQHLMPVAVTDAHNISASHVIDLLPFPFSVMAVQIPVNDPYRISVKLYFRKHIFHNYRGALLRQESDPHKHQLKRND